MTKVVLRGLIGMVASAAGYTAFLMLLSGGPVGFVSAYRNYSISDWTFVVPILIGGFVSGLLNGVLKSPLRYLVLGILLIPPTAFGIYLFNLDAIERIAQLVLWVIIPVAATTVSVLPSFLFWIVVKRSRSGVKLNDRDQYT